MTALPGSVVPPKAASEEGAIPEMHQGPSAPSLEMETLQLPGRHG